MNLVGGLHHAATALGALGALPVAQAFVRLPATGRGRLDRAAGLTALGGHDAALPLARGAARWLI